MTDFDWTGAIDKQVRLIGRIIAFLFSAVDVNEVEGIVIPRRVRDELFAILRPAESALRRLIFVMAMRLERPPQPIVSGVKSKATRRAGTKLANANKINSNSFTVRTRPTTQSFRLRDRRKDFGHLFYDEADEVALPVVSGTEQIDNKPVIATNLVKRIVAIKNALDDLPREARRMRKLLHARQRWLVGDEKHTTVSRRIPLPPLRPGLPPGARLRPPKYGQIRRQETEAILEEADWLARQAQA
ncbi:MAG: hypothetical protein AAGI92_00650 [Pseudomonadota bacterium]